MPNTAPVHTHHNSTPINKTLFKPFHFKKSALSAAIAAALTLGAAGQTHAATLSVSAPSNFSEGVGSIAVIIDLALDFGDASPTESCTVTGTLREGGEGDISGDDYSIPSPNFTVTYEPDVFEAVPDGEGTIQSRAVPATVTVNIVDDTLVEGNESGAFFADNIVSNCSFYGGVINNDSASFTITDNDTEEEPEPPTPPSELTVDTQTRQVLVSMGNLSLEGAKLQSQNLSKQLRRLRSGLRGNDLSSLNLKLDGNTLSGNDLNKLLGAGAGDDGLNSQWGTFVGGSIQIGDQDSSDDNAGYEFNVDNFFAGIDYQLNKSFIIGGALGYTNSSAEINDNAGDTTLSGLSLGLFSSYYYKDSYYIDAIISYGQSDYDTSRDTAVGTSTQTIKGKAEGDEISLALNTGYYFRMSNHSIQLYGSLNYVDANIDGFDERNTSGSTATLLSVDDQNLKSLTSNIGIEYGLAINTRSAVITPQVYLDWEHQYEDDTEIVSGRFIGDPNDTTFQVEDRRQDRNYFNLGLSLSAVLKGGFSAYTSYEVDLSRDDLDLYDINVGARWEF